MIKFKLKRIGRKFVPSYRVVLVESAKSPKSRHIDDVGFYDAQKGISQINVERAKSWLSKGAQMSETVYMLFYKAGIVSSAPVKKTKIVVPKEEAKK
ncbi:MAG: 30S ribosomal protein S16 [Patescibacteria group bacterium]